MLIVRSQWAPAHPTQPAFEQDPTFFYFAGADHLLGAIHVLDGKSKRAERFLLNALPPFIHGVGLEIAEGLPDVLRAGMFLDYEPIFVVDGRVSSWKT